MTQRFRHTRRPEWGTAALVAEDGDKRTYDFGDRVRVISRDFWHLMEPAGDDGAPAPEAPPPEPPRAAAPRRPLHAPIPAPAGEREGRTYVVSSFRLAPCPVGCPEDGRPWGPPCPHQHWFPIHNRVVLDIADGSVRLSCSEGRKAGGPCCRRWDPSEDGAPCEHSDLALKAWRGELGVPESDDPKDVRRASFEKGRVELSVIHKGTPHVPRCPHCRETWSVSPATDADRRRWRKGRKKGAKEPEQLWSCRSPVCSRPGRRGGSLPWIFAEGTDERPKGATRHETPVREGWPWR